MEVIGPFRRAYAAGDDGSNDDGMDRAIAPATSTTASLDLRRSTRSAQLITRRARAVILPARTCGRGSG